MNLGRGECLTVSLVVRREFGVGVVGNVGVDEVADKENELEAEVLSHALEIPSTLGDLLAPGSRVGESGLDAGGRGEGEVSTGSGTRSRGEGGVGCGSEVVGVGEGGVDGSREGRTEESDCESLR